MLISKEFDQSVAERRKQARRTAKDTARKLAERVAHFLKRAELNPYIDKKTLAECEDIIGDVI